VGNTPVTYAKKLVWREKKQPIMTLSYKKLPKKWDLILTLLSILEDPHFTLVCYPAFHHSDYAEPIIEVPKPPPNLRIVSFVF
jgi:hypothetical protein